MTAPVVSRSLAAPDGALDQTPRCSPDELRRLDWRFLLPDPDLDEVACIASAGSSLISALRASGGRVRPLDRHRPAAPRHRLVVVDDADVEALRVGAAAVSPGGWLYAEFARGPRRLRGWLYPPARCRRDLRRLGFDRIALAWHRPDFDRPVEITPLDEPAAGAFAMSRAPVSIKRWLQLAVGRMLHRAHLLPLLVPCFSVFAEKRVQPAR